MTHLKIMSIPCFFFLFLFAYTFPLITQAQVPPSKTFNYINEGEFGFYIVEYDGNYRTTPIFTSPFQLMFYNTTPNAYTLALLMGLRRSNSGRNWVWEANRGNPVGDNATFSLKTDGNLVLADADGRVAWQSNTANKGVVGFELLPTGNMVLHDARGNFIWQSFDYPTDNLLVGQSLRPTGPIKLVSRLSATENKNGPYSLVIEPDLLGFYYKTENSPRPVLYNRLQFDKNTLKFATFNSTPETDEGFSYRLILHYNEFSNVLLSKTNYNSTSSYLRLGIDGNLKAFTYYNKVEHLAWEETFTFFRREFGGECRLPDRCGKFGLCEDSQCVACPTPTGLSGWSKDCGPPKLTSCKPKDIKYFKLEGVDHFITRYAKGIGPVKEEECERKCTSDCKCSGFFVKRAESRCWIVYDLMTLRKVDNVTHVGYIKAPAR